MDSALATLRGILTFKRPLSKRLVFYDLEVAVGGATSLHDVSGVEWAELLVKADDILLSLEQARSIRDAVRLGDRVEVTGHHEEPSPLTWAEPGVQPLVPHHHTFVVQAVRVLERWSELHPGSHFVPRPAPWSRKQPAQQQEQRLHPGAPQPVSTGRDARAELAVRGSGSGLSSGTAGGDEEQEAGAEAQGAEAEPSAAGQQALCKYWAATGRCPKGPTCRFAHPPARGGAAGAQHTFAVSRRAERLAAAAAQGFVHEAGDGAKRRRAAVLAEWLVATYGRDFLNSGTGVMDVAGGRGALTFHLTLHCGVRCTLVEPRRLAALSRQQHRDLVAAGVKAADFHLPQLRVRFGPELWRRGQQQAAAMASLPLEEQQQHLSAGEEDEGEEKNDDEEEEQEEQEEQEEGQEEQRDGEQAEASAAGEAAELRDEAERLLRGCSLVVGLHPDQATDSIQDFALECGKPFAIVPCCVFPRLFPHRRLRQPVSTPDTPENSAGVTGTAAVARALGGGMSSRGGSGAVASSAITPAPLLPELEHQATQVDADIEVPVESYPQLLVYLRQRAEDASGLAAGSGRRRRRRQDQLQQLEAAWDDEGGFGEGGQLAGSGGQEADEAEAAAVGSTAGTLLWLEEQAGRWEHGGQDAGGTGAWGKQRQQGEVLAHAAPAAVSAGDPGQGSSGAAVGVRYACVGMAKLTFTGANQVVFALPAKEVG